MRRGFLGAAAMSICLLAGSNAAAQDFQRSYSIGQGGHIRIRNISGDIKVTAYSGRDVVVAGYKTGRDRDVVEIEDSSADDRIDLRVRYPERCNCDAGVNFEVKVPQNVDYNFDHISSVSGSVELEGVRGRIRAESVSGNVDILDVTGMVSASSVSGNVDADISKVEGSGDMKFSSVSGNVYVKAPSSLDADVEMSTVSGSLRTDFPIEIIERRYGPGRSARGRVGNGSCSLRITSVSGRVSLTKK